MARKKIERRIKQVIIRAGNIKEVFSFGKNEKLLISKDEKKHKMLMIKKEIKKAIILQKNVQKISDKTNSTKSNTFEKKIENFHHEKESNNTNNFSHIELFDKERNKQENNKESDFAFVGNEQKDEMEIIFDDFLFNFF